MESLIMLVVFVVGLGLMALNARNIKRKWESWPTVDEYMNKYNPSKGRGISCCKCGSHQIWESGFEKDGSDMRIHFCKQCKTYLYRTSR